MGGQNRRHGTESSENAARGQTKTGCAFESRLFLSVAEHFRLKRAAIDAGKVLFHCRCEQGNVRNFTEVLGDEPGRFIRGHPVAMIESRQVYRARVTPQCAFAAEVEVNIEVTHGQLAQAAIDRLAITAPGEIGFRYGAPAAAHFENRDDMIGVLFGFQIEDQRWKSEDT